MNLSVIIDFLILSQENPKKIYVGDSSNWGVAVSQPAYLNVTPPGAVNPITLTFEKNKLTILHSLNLGLSCFVNTCDEQELVELPDGIWEIELLSSYQGLSKKQYFLKDDSLRMDLGEVYIKAGLEYSSTSKVIKDLAKVEFFLNVAKSHVKKGDFVKSKKAFDKASEIVENYKTCKDCY